MNYNKLINEVNDQNAVPQGNDLIAFTTEPCAKQVA